MNTLTGARHTPGMWSGIERRQIDATEPTDARLRRIGEFVFRYGLAAIFVWIGLLKFTGYEAKNIEPLVTNSPLWSWAVLSMGLQGVSVFVGLVEISIGLLIAARHLSPRLSMIGSLGAVVTFVITLSFMLTTPGVWEPGYGFGFLSALPGQFLAKDMVLVGVSIWNAGEALRGEAIGRTAKRSTALQESPDLRPMH